MPLTARDASGSDIDSTECSDEFWSSIHKVKPKAELHCRDCGSLMQPKNSNKGLRFFRHFVADEHCPSNGETPAHLDLKKRVAVLIRNSGAKAVLEATPSHGDHGGWRADVLAVTEDGRRIAFEIQLAGMTLEEGKRRSEQYIRDGISVIWITTRKVHWLFGIPAVRVLVDGEQLLVLQGLAMLRVRGHVLLSDSEDSLLNTENLLQAFLTPEQNIADFSHLKYFPFEWHGVEAGVDFQSIVAGLLDESILPKTVDSFLKNPRAESYPTNQEVVVVSKAHIDESERRKEEFEKRINDAREQVEREIAKRRAELQKELEEADRRRKNSEALRDRQIRVLRSALQELVKDTSVDQELWIGVLAEKWNPDSLSSITIAEGNEKTGYGIPIWKSPKNGERSLVGIVCPVARRLSPDLGRSWRKRFVRVFVETEYEAVYVARSLNWESNSLKVIPNNP